MEMLALVASGLSVVAIIVSGVALYFVMGIQRQLKTPASDNDGRKQEYLNRTANIFSDGSMVWQRLVIQCDEISGMLAGSMVQGATRETIGDWLLQLREFCKKSKNEIDNAYQLFMSEAKRMDAAEMELQQPDMDRFNKEMKSNVSVISDQLEHLRSVLRGQDILGNRQLKITLHQPQVMPHFLRKRQKMADIQRRRNLQTVG